MTWIQVIVTLIEKSPQIESLFVRIFGAYMRHKHRIDMKKFLELEEEARKTGDTTKLQEIIGRKL